MGQPDKAQPRRIGLALRVETQHPLARQRLDEPVERGLGVGAVIQQFAEPHGTTKRRHAVQHLKRLAHRTVALRCAGHASSLARQFREPPVLRLLTRPSRVGL